MLSASLNKTFPSLININGSMYLVFYIPMFDVNANVDKDMFFISYITYLNSVGNWLFSLSLAPLAISQSKFVYAVQKNKAF